MRIHLLRLTVVAAALAAVAAAAPPASATAPAPAVSRQLVLINGDRLVGGVVIPPRHGSAPPGRQVLTVTSEAVRDPVRVR